MKILKAWSEWIPVVLLALFVMIGVAYCTSQDEDPVEVVSSPQPFNPVALLGLRIEPTIVTQGGKATIYNGFCNNTDLPVIAEMFLAVERRPVSTSVQPEVIVFIQRPPGQGEGRGAISTIDIGCSEEKPREVEIPVALPPGEWRAFLEVVVRGENGQEQREAEFSNYFTVVTP